MKKEEFLTKVEKALQGVEDIYLVEIDGILVYAFQEVKDDLSIYAEVEDFPFEAV